MINTETGAGLPDAESYASVALVHLRGHNLGLAAMSALAEAKSYATQPEAA